MKQIRKSSNKLIEFAERLQLNFFKQFQYLVFQSWQHDLFCVRASTMKRRSFPKKCTYSWRFHSNDAFDNMLENGSACFVKIQWIRRPSKPLSCSMQSFPSSVPLELELLESNDRILAHYLEIDPGLLDLERWWCRHLLVPLTILRVSEM